MIENIEKNVILGNICSNEILPGQNLQHKLDNKLTVSKTRKMQLFFKQPVSAVRRTCWAHKNVD